MNEAEPSPFRTAARVHRITGPAASGKTQRLVERAAELAAGQDAGRIALFAATPDAADALRARLRGALGDGQAPAVLCALEYEFALLGTPEAVEATGRSGRVMMRYEENVFLEDMKTSGVQPRRLAQMLKFLYRSCADLERMDFQWFYNDDEEDAFKLMNRLQDHLGCYVRPLVAPAALQVARELPGAFAPFRFDHVLVDDYQMLSKASQCLLGLAARTSLTVAGDPCAHVHALEDYPYPAGLDDLVEANGGTCEELASMHAGKAVAQAVGALRSDEALGGTVPTCTGERDGSVRVLACAGPREEFEAAADAVAAWVDGGIPARDIAVVAPRGAWERNLAKALAARDIPVAAMSRPTVAGDVRTLETSVEGRIVSILRLLADPQDQMALRCWCGFGDYLANSALFCGLCAANVRIELGTTAIHATAGEDALFEQQRDRVLQALELARGIIGRVGPLRGQALVHGIARELGCKDAPDALVRALSPMPAQATAAEMLDVLDRNTLFPRLKGDGVAIGSFEDLTGLGFRAVAMVGLVNGFTPQSSWFDPTAVERDRREELLGREMAKTYAAAGKAAEHLLLTYFTALPLGDAERLKLKVDRVRLIDGVRTCEINPSETIRALTGKRFRD